MELFYDKKGDDWKLLLTIVTSHFVLNVTGVLDPIVEHIDKFRLRQ